MNEIMKYLYRIAILFAVMFAVSCKKDKDDPQPEPEPDPTVTLDLSFVLPDGAGKAAWEAGDKIVVHGEYAKDQVIVTLSAADISGDGKTATLTVSNLKPYKRTDCTSNLYAAYPAEAVDNLTHCFFYSKFNGTNQELFAACNNGNTFNFKNVCSTLTFSVDDALDVDSYEFFANKKEAVGYEFLQVKITDQVTELTQYKGEPILKLTGNVSPVTKICVPNGTALAGGFTMKFFRNGKPVKIYKDSDKAQFVAGELTELGDITDDINDYEDPFAEGILDIDADGNANCYIVTEPGSYKFKAVRGNISTEFLQDIDHAVVLWETWNDRSEVEANSVIKSVAFAEDYMIFHTPETLRPGNAVIAAVADNGDVVWSWHIWVPKTAITTNSYGNIMGAPLMSRNLGALVDAVAGSEPIDPLSYGLVYQWGRKDPFTGAGAFKTNKIATWAGEAEEVVEGAMTVEEAIAHPRRVGGNPDGDWLTKKNDELWSDDGKTIYDPCPPGYRVPARKSDKPFWSSKTNDQVGWGVDGTNGWITVGEPKAVFPIAGYRDDWGVGSITKVGDRALYWTAHGSDLKAYGADLRYDKSKYTLASPAKTRLASVRCVVDEK